MPIPDAEAIRAAARRLRGHVVDTPLLGGLQLPGAGAADLRLWPDQLQPGGSLWSRGHQHFLLRQLGACKSLVMCGSDRRAAAAAVAAAAHRLPLRAFLPAAPRAELAALLQRLGAEVEVVADGAAAADQHRRRHGATLLPGGDDADVAAGLATSGLELAAKMPRDTALVVAPLELAACIGAGLAAGGMSCRVLGAAVTAGAGADLAAPLLAAHRLGCDADGLAVLDLARHQGGGTVVAVIAE